MIKTWTIEKFKSVSRKTSLDVAPLTIFSGENSSGKSTVIQSLLLTMQTLQSPVNNRAVILNGHVVKLGTFNDIVSDGCSSDFVSIGFELVPQKDDHLNSFVDVNRSFYMSSVAKQNEIITVAGSYTFSSNGINEKKETLQLQPSLEDCSIKVLYKEGESINEEDTVIVKSKKTIDQRMEYYKLSDMYTQQNEIATLEYEVASPKKTNFERDFLRLRSGGQIAGVSFMHFMPDMLSIVFDATEEDARRLVEGFIYIDEFRYREFSEDTLNSIDLKFREIITNTVIDTVHSYAEKTVLPDARTRKYLQLCDNLRSNFSIKTLQSLYVMLPQIRQELVRRLGEKYQELMDIVKEGKEPQFRMAFSPLNRLTRFAVSYAQQFFASRVKYLGPLRDEPKPLYPISGAIDTKEIGFKGEHTAAVLDAYKDTIIHYISSNNFNNNTELPSPKSDTLQNAVLDWLNYMGVASSVDTIDKGKLGHEMRVTTQGSDHFHDLTHVGVGVSQVLPILVLALLADRGSTMIFEQPELHLHPRVQSRLADFFLSMTLLNKQCIVETHSEYMINRLRYRAVISNHYRIPENVVIYFAEKREGRSEYKPIRINNFGVIDGWPKGFFDETEENSRAILMESMLKRKKESR